MRRILLLLTFTVAVLTATADVPQKREYHLPPEKLQRAIDFSRAKYTLHFVETFWSLLVIAGILEFGWSARARTLAEAVSRKWVVQALIFAPVVTLLTDVPMLPVNAYLQHLELKYEQSVQGWGSWLWDWTKGESLSVIAGTVMACILFGTIRWSPRRWWLWFWAAAMPILVFVFFITPVVIDPMFNSFQPLTEKHTDLVTQLQRVTARGGLDIPADRMFEMKASEKVTSLNAYVTGFGATKRVVVWDTTIARCPTNDILFTFGHEMGHYVLLHIPKTMTFIALLLLASLYAGYRGLGWLIVRRGEAWGVRGQSDWAAMPALLLLITAFSFIAEPITNGFSRYQEHQADVYGLEVIHGLVPESQTVAADSFQLLGEVSLSDPNPPPFIEFWLYSHPSIGSRLSFAESYDPWSRNESPQFVK